MSTDSVLYRLAQRSDIPALNEMMYALHDEHHQASPDYFKTAVEILDHKSVNDYIDTPDGLMFVAEEDNQLIGFVTASMSELDSTVTKPIFTGAIDEFYVMPAYRQHGYGEGLLQRAAKELKNFGVKQIYVEVWAFNQAALRLYEKLGFHRHIYCLKMDTD